MFSNQLDKKNYAQLYINVTWILLVGMLEEPSVLIGHICLFCQMTLYLSALLN